MKGMKIAILLVVALLSAVNALALGQPSVNLGFTSFVDGAPPAGPGWYVQEYLQYYTADQINDERGDKVAPLGGVDVAVLMNQLTYQSDQELNFGGKWGINLMLPIVSIDADFALLEGGSGLGDLLIGPYVQYDPIMGESGPIMLNRIELQTILPTGEYDKNKALNPGSNHYSFDPYWAATLFLGPRVTTSWRLHWLYNWENDEWAGGTAKLKPGQAVHANFAVAYELLPKQLRVGLNGYYFDQITDTEVNDTKEPSLEEKVFAIGPGVVWHLSQDAHLFFNAYVESGAESRPEGERYNLRFVYHF